MSAHQRASTTRWLLWFPCVYPPNCNTLSNLILCRGQCATSQALTLLWSFSCLLLLGFLKTCCPPEDCASLPLSQALIHKHHLLWHGVNNFCNFSKNEQSSLQQWSFHAGQLAGQLLYEWIRRSSWDSTSKCRLSAISEMSICQGEDND